MGLRPRQEAAEQGTYPRLSLLQHGARLSPTRSASSARSRSVKRFGSRCVSRQSVFTCARSRGIQDAPGLGHGAPKELYPSKSGWPDTTLVISHSKRMAVPKQPADPRGSLCRGGSGAEGVWALTLPFSNVAADSSQTARRLHFAPRLAC